MITKERLKKLIKQGKTVWSTDTKLYFGDLLELEGGLEYLGDGKTIVKLFEKKGRWWHWFKLETLFETKEEAEWHKEFGNITRTERLTLPTWEEFSNRVKNIGFKAYPYDYYCYTDGRYVEIKEYYHRGYNSGDRVFFSKPLTKENYILACRKCKELFLGEEND